jgi:O-antigen ligase
MIAAIGLVILVVGSVLFLGGEGSLLRGIGLQPDAGDITSGRSHFWNVAWQIFLANPILGAGFEAFGAAFTRYDTWSGMYRIEHAHNDYLQMLADGGILAFACVAAFVYFFFRKGVAALGGQNDGLHRSIVTGAMAGCFGILIHSFFDFPLRTPANAFVFLLLVVLAVGNVGRGERSRRRRSS